MSFFFVISLLNLQLKCFEKDSPDQLLHCLPSGVSTLRLYINFHADSNKTQLTAKAVSFVHITSVRMTQ